jgi:hypothetical protein
MAKITVEVGPELFRFETFQQWVNKAASWFRRAGVSSADVLCVDRRGRICTGGTEFIRANKEGTFPVVAYLVASDLVVEGVAQEREGREADVSWHDPMPPAARQCPPDQDGGSKAGRGPGGRLGGE